MLVGFIRGVDDLFGCIGPIIILVTLFNLRSISMVGIAPSIMVWCFVEILGSLKSVVRRDGIIMDISYSTHIAS